MKTQTTVKPTQEEKAAYMATYWGQKVWIVSLNGTGFIQKVCASYFTKYSLKHRCLLLTSLSDITDEDAIEVCEMSFRDLYAFDKEFKIGVGGRLVNSVVSDESSYFSGALCCAINDFLRSRGYALPFRNYSVQDLQEFGWLKLRQKGGEGGN